MKKTKGQIQAESLPQRTTAKFRFSCVCMGKVLAAGEKLHSGIQRSQLQGRPEMYGMAIARTQEQKTCYESILENK